MPTRYTPVESLLFPRQRGKDISGACIGQPGPSLLQAKLPSVAARGGNLNPSLLQFAPKLELLSRFAAFAAACQVKLKIPFSNFHKRVANDTILSFFVRV